VTRGWIIGAVIFVMGAAIASGMVAVFFYSWLTQLGA
jgi:hypothetical protein